jgi:uncharacterized protein YegJ (DUF2314 family)
VITVEEDDPEMNAAIAKARSTLPEFWKHFDSPGPGEGNFVLKVEINDGKVGEHFWVSSLERKDGKLLGTIDNEPSLVKNVKNGERIEIPQDKISDWMYMRNGKMVGNETARPLLKKMPKEEAEAVRAMLEVP